MQQLIKPISAAVDGSTPSQWGRDFPSFRFIGDVSSALDPLLGAIEEVFAGARALVDALPPEGRPLSFNIADHFYIQVGRKKIDFNAPSLVATDKASPRPPSISMSQVLASDGAKNGLPKEFLESLIQATTLCEEFASAARTVEADVCEKEKWSPHLADGERVTLVRLIDDPEYVNDNPKLHRDPPDGFLLVGANHPINHSLGTAFKPTRTTTFAQDEPYSDIEQAGPGEAAIFNSKWVTHGSPGTPSSEPLHRTAVIQSFGR